MYLDGVRFAKDVFSNRYSELFSHVGAAKLGRSVREKIGQDIDGAGLVCTLQWFMHMQIQKHINQTC